MNKSPLPKRTILVTSPPSCPSQLLSPTTPPPNHNEGNDDDNDVCVQKIKNLKSQQGLSFLTLESWSIGHWQEMKRKGCGKYIAELRRKRRPGASWGSSIGTQVPPNLARGSPAILVVVHTRWRDRCRLTCQRGLPSMSERYGARHNQPSPHIDGLGWEAKQGPGKKGQKWREILGLCWDADWWGGFAKWTGDWTGEFYFDFYCLEHSCK